MVTTLLMHYLRHAIPIHYPGHTLPTTLVIHTLVKLGIVSHDMGWGAHRQFKTNPEVETNRMYGIVHLAVGHETGTVKTNNHNIQAPLHYVAY